MAERHDLIAKLFVDTAPSPVTGCYALRLFLDGRWQTVTIDDKLPVTSKPRREELAFSAKLAYSRCGSVATGKQQMWVSLLEKAYAKAHGSYQSISGGEIAEALHDLTGAPTLSIDFSSDQFSSESLWQRLLYYKRMRLPIGCATAADPTLAQVKSYKKMSYTRKDLHPPPSPSPLYMTCYFLVWLRQLQRWGCVARMRIPSWM